MLPKKEMNEYIENKKYYEALSKIEYGLIHYNRPNYYHIGTDATLINKITQELSKLGYSYVIYEDLPKTYWGYRIIPNCDIVLQKHCYDDSSSM